MTLLFLGCAALGALVLILQILFGLFGMGHGLDALEEGDAPGAAELGAGLELLSVRSLSAGTAFFGVGGLAALSLGLPGGPALLLALVAGLVGLVGTALLMRQVLRLESDGSIRIAGAIGAPATVYLPIPGRQGGPGKIQVALQGRTVELQAVTQEPQVIPTGASVVVVSVLDADTVEVVPTSILQEVLDGNA